MISFEYLRKREAWLDKWIAKVVDIRGETSFLREKEKATKSARLLQYVMMTTIPTCNDNVSYTE